MKKKDRVKSQILFNKIINEGKKIFNNNFTIFFLENDTDDNLYGISAPKRLGNAVVRNKIKRQTREMIHDLSSSFKKGRYYIIINKERNILDSYKIRYESLKKLIGEMNEK